MIRNCLLTVSGALTVALALSACGLASEGGSGVEVTLRLSHQWPAVDNKGEGDFRAVLAQRFADRVKERTEGRVEVKVYPSNSLIEDPTKQYEAITQGSLDMSVFPLDYASGDVPEFSITLMPAMVRNHAQARKWKDAEIGRRVHQMTEQNGIEILTWVWNAGAIGTKGGEPILAPEDVRRGTVTRAAGPRIEQMLQSVGFGLSSMPSSEIYNGMQTGVLDSAITSTSSFSSFRLYEQVKSYTSPLGGNTFWFILSPLIIGTEQFQQLTADQRRILQEAGAELQQFAYEAAEQDDARVDEQFRKAGVNVVSMDDASFEKWRERSEPIWADFAKDVPDGAELIDLAEKVTAQ